MARVFITGSSQGLGLMAGQLLIAEGHEVVLHGRDQARADAALTGAPGARSAIAGDLSSLAAMRHVAEQANDLGPFDAVIHNVGVGIRSHAGSRRKTACRTSSPSTSSPLTC